MTEKILTELNIRTYLHSDMEDVIHIWKESGLIRSWNNPRKNYCLLSITVSVGIYQIGALCDGICN